MAKQYLARQSGNRVNVLGPIPAVMEKKAGRYRYQLLLQSTHRSYLRQSLSQLTDFLTQQKTSAARRVRWHIDVDPQETI